MRVFVMPRGAFAEVAAQRHEVQLGDFGRLHAAPFRDFFLEQLCQRLWAESEAGNPHGDLLADGALIAIAATLLRLRDGAMPETRDRQHALLATHVRRQINDYIDTHLDQSLAIRDLAVLVDQPAATFAHAFRSAFGQTPHQYVLSRRLARAQELLAAGDLALAEIAYACGFASQSHMTDVFRQKLGVTPGRYRKEARR